MSAIRSMVGHHSMARTSPPQPLGKPSRTSKAGMLPRRVGTEGRAKRGWNLTGHLRVQPTFRIISLPLKKYRYGRARDAARQ